MVPRTRSAIAVLLAVAAVLSGVSAARVSAQIGFRTGVELVRVDVAVTRSGRPVTGLSADDFEVTDNGKAQRVAAVFLDAEPINVLLVLDTSDSLLAPGLRDLTRAVQSLVRALRPSDRVSLVTFGTGVTVPIALTREFADVDRVVRSLSLNGSTSLRDGVFTALQLMPADGSRSVVLVFTDGIDNLSWLTASDLLEVARRTLVVIHAVQLGPTSSGAFLERLTRTAGGHLWPTVTSGQLQPRFTEALEEMRSRYLLSYAPEVGAQPGWHELKVKLKRGRGDVNARPGYFVPARGSSIIPSQ